MKSSLKPHPLWVTLYNVKAFKQLVKKEQIKNNSKEIHLLFLNQKCAIKILKCGKQMYRILFMANKKENGGSRKPDSTASKTNK